MTPAIMFRASAHVDLQMGHWSLERAMQRINFSKRKRESADEDELAEMKAAVETAKGIVNQVITAASHYLMRLQVDAGSASILSILDAAHGMYL